jgi:phosphoribosyl-ATP pyrophosphohydrolase
MRRVSPRENDLMAKSPRKRPATQTRSKPSGKAPRQPKTGKNVIGGSEEAVQPPANADAQIVPAAFSGADVLNRLWTIIDSRRDADPALSHSARLLAKGTPQVAQKLGEEFVECLIEAVGGNRDGLMRESADVLYHLLVTWVNAGLRPEEVWAELERREEISQMTEDGSLSLKKILSKTQATTTKIP